MNLTPPTLARPPKSPRNASGGKTMMRTTPPPASILPPPRPQLKRSVSAPLSQLHKQYHSEGNLKEKDRPPLQVKIYDGVGDDDGHDEETLSLSWLESALETPREEETKQKSPRHRRRKSHRRGRAFSWDGGRLSSTPSSTHKSHKTPTTPSTLETEAMSSPESSPETDSTDPRNWSLCTDWKHPGGRNQPKSRRGKPPKASPPLRFSKNVGSVDAKPRPTVMSRTEIQQRVNLCLKTGDYETALALSDKVLQEDQKRYGHHHASVGIALHNIGMVYLHSLSYDMAESIFLQAVIVRKNALGPEHLDVVHSLTKLGSVRLELRRYEAALSAFCEALRVSRKNLGYGHSSVAQIQSHIGCVYHEVGEYSAAQATFEDSLDIYRTLWASGIDTDEAVVAVTEMLCNVGSIQTKRKNYVGAIASFSESLDLQRLTRQGDQPRLFATLDNLGHALSKNKDYAEAAACFKELLRVQVEYYGTYNDECYRTAKKQSIIHEKMQKLGEQKQTNMPLMPVLDASSGLVVQ